MLTSSWASTTWRIRLGVSFWGLPNRTFRWRAIFTPAAHRSSSRLRSNSAGRQDAHHHLSGRGARVDVVHQRHELRALALDLFDDLKEVKLDRARRSRR